MDIKDLSVHFDLQGSAFARLFGRKVGTVKAVDGVNLRMRAGEVVGLVGESGSGKSTLGRSLLGLVPATSGSIFFEDVDIATMSRRDLREIRQYVQMIFQDPNAALNPGMTIEQAVGDPLRIHGMKSADERRKRVIDALERVGLSPVELFLSKYPKDLSGGQKQRVVIARAIILGPSVLVADEPISMLDMSRPRQDPAADAGPEGAAGPHLRLHHSRPGERQVLLRPDRDHVSRQDRRDRGHGGDLREPQAPVHEGVARCHPRPRPGAVDAAGPAQGRDPRRRASRRRAAAFHPRCPAAFDMCGWESRDLAATLESHWLRTGVSTFDVERSQIANLDELGGQDGRRRAQGRRSTGRRTPSTRCSTRCVGRTRRPASGPASTPSSGMVPA